MIPDLHTQIKKLNEQLVGDEEPMVKLAQIVPNLNFQRGYLPCSIDINEENSAKQKFKLIKDKKETVSKLQDSIGEKNNYLKNLKSPILFGKAKYQDDVDRTQREIKSLQSDIEKIKQDIKSEQDALEKAEQIILKANSERKKNDDQYFNDERIFNNEKEKLVNSIAKSILFMLEEVIEGEWGDIKDSLKYFFRTSPENNIFPIIGWEHAFVCAVAMVAHIEDWKELQESLIIQGEAKDFKQLIEDFLLRYVNEDDKHEDNVLYQTVKANVLFAQISSSKDTSLLFYFRDSLPSESLKNACTTTLNSEKFELGPKLRALFLTLEKAKNIAIKNNDENLLGVVVEEEKRYEDFLGWLKPYLK